MWVRGVGEEVVSLDTPGLLGVVQRLEVARRGGVVDVDAELLVVAVDVVADLVHVLEPHICVAIVKILPWIVAIIILV